ncbi:MAG: hypothetical protein AAF587_12990 [Bacteroidota bacterium]
MDNPVILIGGAAAFFVAAFILIQSKKTIFWTAFILVFFPIDYLNRYFVNIPTIGRWLPLLTMVGFAMLIFLVMTDRKAQFPRSMVWIYRLFLGVSILSMIANHTAVGALVVAQRGFIMVFAFMTMLKAVYYIYDKHDLFTFVVWGGLASSFCAFFQRFFFVMVQGRSADMVAGLFPVDGIYLHFQLVVIAIVLSYWLQGRRVNRYMSNDVVLVILMMSLALGNNKAGFLFLGLIIAFVASIAGVKTVMRNFGKLLAGFAMVGLVGMIFSAMFNKTYEESDEEDFSEAIQRPEYIQRYLFGGKLKHQKFAPSGQLLRGASVEFAYLLIVEDPITSFIGMGPGSTQHSNMPGAMGWLEEKYPGYTIGRVPTSMYLAETGWIGLLLQILLLFSIYHWKPKHAWQDRPEFIMSRKAFVVATLFFYIYENLYFEPVFALLIGVMVYPNVKPKVEEEEEEGGEAEDTLPPQEEITFNRI